MTKISIVLSVRNEGKKINRTLSSVRWADEIIVIDNGSTDETASIARRFTKKVYNKPNDLMLNKNKNYGFSLATSDWILSLDGDEEVPEALRKEIQSALDCDDSVSAFWIPRKNIIFNKWIEHGIWWPDKQLRLFRRGKGKFPCLHVHEYLEVEGQTRDLTEPYLHYNYESISQYVRKMDELYTESEVQKLTDTNYQIVWYDAVRFPASDFLKIYFAQEGYKDGLHGLVLSFLQAFYSFIVFAKLWEKRQFADMPVSLSDVVSEFTSVHDDIRYWTLTEKIKKSGWFFKLYYRFIRHYGNKHI